MGSKTNYVVFGGHCGMETALNVINTGMDRNSCLLAPLVLSEVHLVWTLTSFWHQVRIFLSTQAFNGIWKVFKLDCKLIKDLLCVKFAPPEHTWNAFQYCKCWKRTGKSQVQNLIHSWSSLCDFRLRDSDWPILPHRLGDRVGIELPMQTWVPGRIYGLAENKKSGSN